MPSEQINRALFVHSPSKDLIGVGEDAGAVVSVRPYVPNQLMMPDDKIVEENALVITWNKDAGWVQAYIRFDMNRMAEYIDEWRKGNDGEFPGQTMGSVFVDFADRTELTKLASIAKRAKIAAFGE